MSTENSRLEYKTSYLFAHPSQFQHSVDMTKYRRENYLMNNEKIPRTNSSFDRFLLNHSHHPSYRIVQWHADLKITNELIYRLSTELIKLDYYY